MNYPNYISELLEATYDMWKKGWDEYNGGNVSYRLKKEEILRLKDDLQATNYPIMDKEQTEIQVMEIPHNMVGEYLLITASGSHFRYLHHQPEIDTGIIKLTKRGYQLIAGFKDGKRPTSEIFMHILAHAARLQQDSEQRVVIHNHATNIVLYSLLHQVTSRSLTFDLWSVLTESIVVFPDGIAVLPWEVPGTQTIGELTAKELVDHRLVVWAKHGVLSTGRDYQDCFGLIETADKAAHIALELQRISGKELSKNNILTKENLQAVCKVLHVTGKYL